MSANLTELTRSTSPGSPATPNGVTVEAAEAPAAPQVLDAAAAAAASRLTPAPTTAALATHLRRVLGVGDGAAVAPAAARPVVVSPRDMAAKVRDIMSRVVARVVVLVLVEAAQQVAVASADFSARSSEFSWACLVWTC